MGKIYLNASLLPFQKQSWGLYDYFQELHWSYCQLNMQISTTSRMNRILHHRGAQEGATHCQELLGLQSGDIFMSWILSKSKWDEQTFLSVPAPCYSGWLWRFEFDKMRISRFIFLLQIFYVNEPSVLTRILNTSFLENSPEGLCLFHTRSTHPVTQHKITSSCCSKGETASSLLPYLMCWVLFIEQPLKSMQLQPSNSLL